MQVSSRGQFGIVKNGWGDETVKQLFFNGNLGIGVPRISPRNERIRSPCSGVFTGFLHCFKSIWAGRRPYKPQDRQQRLHSMRCEDESTGSGCGWFCMT